MKFANSHVIFQKYMYHIILESMKNLRSKKTFTMF